MIAHSEGGLVSRMYEKEMQNYSPENKFGGLVTFGSSHGGAPIINNKEMISTLAVEACDNIKDAVVGILVTESIGGLKPFARWFVDTVRPGIIDPLVNKSFSDAKETFCSNFLPTILNTLFAAQLKPIGNDYAVGSQNLTELSQFATDIPKISVYGVEENNHVCRALHNMVIGPSADQPLFEAEDEGTVEFINRLWLALLHEQTNRRSSEVYKRAKRIRKQRFLHINPYLMDVTDRQINNVEDAINNLQNAMDFLGTMNDKWLNIMGHKITMLHKQTPGIVLVKDIWVAMTDLNGKFNRVKIVTYRAGAATLK